MKYELLQKKFVQLKRSLLKKGFNKGWLVKHRHRVANSFYFGAVLFAFILSLTHNNRVEASTDTKDYFSYLMIEDDLDRNLEDTKAALQENKDISSNIKAMFQIVDNLVKYKNIEETITLVPGDTLISALIRQGATRDEANKIYSSMKQYYDPRDLKAGQKLKLNVSVDSGTGTMNRVNFLVLEPNIGERIITALKDGTFETFVEKDEIIDEVNAVDGVISDNVSKSMQAHSVPMRVVSNFQHLFDYAIDFRKDVKKGDKFEIIYESKVTPDGMLVKTGEILYAGLTLRNQKITLYRFRDSNGGIDYYTPDGKPLKRTLDNKPLAFRNARISSPFGKRFHPILKKYTIHWGVDYAAPKGSAIFAGGDGVVQVAKYNGAYGNYVKIRHNSEFSTAYGHMSGFAKGIQPGVRVSQGQLIGYVGSTGRSTGPHLHYEVIQNGRRVNPRTIVASTGENLTGSNLANFKNAVEKINASYGKAFAKNKGVQFAER